MVTARTAEQVVASLALIDRWQRLNDRVEQAENDRDESALRSCAALLRGDTDVSHAESLVAAAPPRLVDNLTAQIAMSGVLSGERTWTR